MLVLLPLRTLAASTAGLCNFEPNESLAHNDGTHDHGSAHQHHGPADGEHCGSASFAAPAMPLPVAGQAPSERIAGSDGFAAGFVPDHLDPPPLAL
jgi:hypothetical protein